MGRLHQSRWAPLVGALLDDELRAHQLERVLFHLERCPDCLSDLEAMARMQRSLTRLAQAV